MQFNFVRLVQKLLFRGVQGKIDLCDPPKYCKNNEDCTSIYLSFAIISDWNLIFYKPFMIIFSEFRQIYILNLQVDPAIFSFLF